MKTTITIGQAGDSEVRVKEYASGIRIVETGGAGTKVKGQKPISIKKVRVSESDKKELLAEPDKFKLSKGRLVRKKKKK